MISAGYTVFMAEREREREGPELEWKVRLPRAERVAALFAAFANGVGGRLVVGIRNDGTIAGVASWAQVAAELDAIARARVDPPLDVKIAKRTVEGRVIVEATVRPISSGRARAAGPDGVLVEWVRDGSSTRRASAAEARTLAVADRAARPDRESRTALSALERAGRPILAELARRLRWSSRRTRRAVVQLISSGLAAKAADDRLWITPRGHRALARSGGSR